jgi:transposase
MSEDKGTAALFGEMPAVSEGDRAVPSCRAAPRLQYAVRDQVELRACDLESLLAPDHRARSVWQFVQSLQLAALHEGIRAVQGRPGRPPIDPAILVALWLYATLDGVGSARELARLCEAEDAYRWLCGGVGVNHHTLSDFRVEQASWLDEQLTRSVAALLAQAAVTMNRVAQDGLRIRAHAKAASFRRRERLQQLLQDARDQVQALKNEVDDEPGASGRRVRAARSRAATERERRVADALRTLECIEQAAAPKKAKSKPAAEEEPGSTADAGATAKDRANKDEASKDKAPKAVRVSTTDADARVMKMADGGFRAAFNGQLVADTATQVIAAVALTNVGSDMNPMAPLMDEVRRRYDLVPKQWLADGGFAKHEQIEAVAAAGCAPRLPVMAAKNDERDPHTPREGDRPAIARWRSRMASDEARAIYKERGASVECANAQLRRRDLWRFNVCGMVKARAVLLWHALAHNLQRMIALDLVPQT